MAQIHARHQQRRRTCKTLAGLPAIVRFWDKVDMQSNGCWLWKEGCARKSEAQGGYPMFWDINTATSPQHAVAWAFRFFRKTAPPTRESGNQLSHQPDICEHMSHCVNPWHVEIETLQENIARIPQETKERVAANARSCRQMVVYKQNTVCGHLDRKHHATGRCSSCYVTHRFQVNPERRKKAFAAKLARANERYATDPVFREKVLAKCKAYRERKRQEKLNAAA